MYESYTVGKGRVVIDFHIKLKQQIDNGQKGRYCIQGITSLELTENHTSRLSRGLYIIWKLFINNLITVSSQVSQGHYRSESETSRFVGLWTLTVPVSSEDRE